MKQRIPLLFFCVFSLLLFTGCGGGGSTAVPNMSSWASLGITSGSRQITVSWTKLTAKASGTSSYNIYWSTRPGVTKDTGNKIAAVTSPYVHSGLTNDSMYYYVVTEVIDNKEGPVSLEVATAPKAVVPLAPVGITVAPQNGTTQIKIDRTGAAVTTKFNLYWSKTADFANAIKISNAFGSLSTFQHTALANGTMLYYGVTAEGPEGESPMSRAVAATPLADISATNYQVGVSTAAVAAPTAITAVASNQQTTLAWNMPSVQLPTIFDPAATPTMPPIISAYTIYWSSSPITSLGTAHKIIVPVTAKTKLPLTYTHNTGLVNSIPYYYRITAVAGTDANGNPLKTADGKSLTFESLPGSQVMVVPEAKTAAAPTGFTATSGQQKITLGWLKSSTANTTYNIYYSKTPPVKPEDLVTPAGLLATTTEVSYTHSGLQNNTSNYYVVTAKAEGESAPSPIVVINLW